MGWQQTVLIVGVPAIIFLAYYYYTIELKKEKVRVLLHENIDGRIFWTNPTKKTMARVVNEGGAVKLRFPKAITKMPQTPPEAKHCIPARTTKYNVVSYLKVTKDQYSPMERHYDIDQKSYEVIVQDPKAALWAQNAARDVDIRNRADEKYAWLKKNAVVVVAIVMAMIIFVYAMNVSKEMAQEDRQEITSLASAIKSFVNRGGIASGAQTETETAPTDAPAPPSG